jgi:hypothetical protein
MTSLWPETMSCSGQESGLEHSLNSFSTGQEILLHCSENMSKLTLGSTESYLNGNLGNK